jgi:soluble lytic murein transglycosylase-like protein
MKNRHSVRRILLCLATLCPLAHAAEHVTLKNGFELDCARREVQGDQMRLYFSDAAGTPANFMDVPTTSIAKIEDVPVAVATVSAHAVAVPQSASVVPTAAEMKEMLASAGLQHHIDADMLASLVLAESGGHVHAVSRTGAKGLMQLMPATAATLGVTDAFQAEQNIKGGTAYLDQLLTRYHDNIALALAAYNAGPGAVDRWHGIPPYRETQAYVVRVIREFNRRKQIGMLATIQ